jgi:hypothetical protein
LKSIPSKVKARLPPPIMMGVPWVSKCAANSRPLLASSGLPQAAHACATTQGTRHQTPGTRSQTPAARRQTPAASRQPPAAKHRRQSVRWHGTGGQRTPPVRARRSRAERRTRRTPRSTARHGEAPRGLPCVHHQTARLDVEQLVEAIPNLPTTKTTPSVGVAGMRGGVDGAPPQSIQSTGKSRRTCAVCL